jgi:hypothetical protein
MTLSFRTRLFLAYSVLLAVALAVATLFAVRKDRSWLVERDAEILERIGHYALIDFQRRALPPDGDWVPQPPRWAKLSLPRHRDRQGRPGDRSSEVSRAQPMSRTTQAARVRAPFQARRAPPVAARQWDDFLMSPFRP